MSTEPVHEWFELTYSSYLVLQRSIMQSMPVQWQTKMVALLEEAREACEGLKDLPSSFQVRAKKDGKYVEDPYRDYQRGRRTVRLRRTRDS